MNPLELRKIILVGYRCEQPDVVVLDSRGMLVERTKAPWSATFAFWIPAPQPHKRCSGFTRVEQPAKHELEALRDGAIIEHVQEFTFPEGEPERELLKRGLLGIWEGLTADSLGLEFNNIPLDGSTKPIFQFTSVTKEKAPDGQSPISLHQ